MDLSDVRVAFLLTDGFEDVELTSPWEAVTGAGADAVLVSPATSTVVTGAHGYEAPVDTTVDEVTAAQFDALVLPGGVVNGDHLRLSSQAVRLVREFFEQDKPVGAICHGGWVLTDADVVRGRTMTSYPSLQTDLRNAGAHWVDLEVVVDGTLVTSRTPSDLPAFNEQLVRTIAGAYEHPATG